MRQLVGPKQRTLALGEIRRIAKAVYRWLKAVIRGWIGYPVIYNANQVLSVDPDRRALLIYLTRPFQLKDNDPLFFSHQNLRQCKQIVSILGEFGYVVDVADVEDKRFRPSKDYDLVISHRADIDPGLFAGALRVYLAAGMNHVVHNRNVRKRYQALYHRRGCHLQAYRLHAENMPFVRQAEIIIGFGNDFVLSTWQETFQQVACYPFNNYGFSSTRYLVDSKDFSTARKSFLFFASQDQVGKGLDLLLEIFPRCPGLSLYICSNFEHEKGLCNCYYRALWKTPNIHPIGWIRVNSARFYDLAQTCAYVILPTCSEGQPGSVVQCMYAGMIPIVTKEAGIDTEDFGITLADDSLEGIEKTIPELAGLPEGWHREHSIQTRKVAEERFSEEAFVDRWREILGKIPKDAR
jgi:glycosyltransferase involved in cell wall biosynthesis